MIDPIAIIELDDATVRTPGGDESAVSRIAVWDWSEISTDGRPRLKCHTNNGDCYVDPADVTDVIDLR